MHETRIKTTCVATKRERESTFVASDAWGCSERFRDFVTIQSRIALAEAAAKRAVKRILKRTLNAPNREHSQSTAILIRLKPATSLRESIHNSVSGHLKIENL